VGRRLSRAGLSDCIPDVVRAGVDQADLAVAAMQLHADSARVGVLGVLERAWSEG